MYNVLICDDQPDIVNALKIYLKPEGYRLFEAFNGRQALNIVKEQDLHLILMDIMMPEMDGIMATSRIREISNVPIIFLTAKSETEDLVAGLGAGADDYITKPFIPAEVLARVRSQLRRYAMLGSRVEENAQELSVGNITLNDGTKTVCVDGEETTLTPHRIQHPAAVDAQSRQGVLHQSPLRSGLAGIRHRQRRRGGCAHPPPAGEDRDRPLQPPLPESDLGSGLQDRRELTG